ncbi:zinc finger BED domain-containing protein 4-like protein [Aphelenchoides avenae]|nr:zinc finger BED domain-containing protein 4-like protein [Aphelenchus avenae]
MDEYDGPLQEERDTLRESVLRRFAELETYRTHGLALFLDPRFRDTVADDSAQFRRNVLQWLTTERQCGRGPELQVLQHLHEPGPSKERSYISSLGSKYSKHSSSLSQPVARRNDLERECNEYVIEACEDWDSNPLDWWKANLKRFPLLGGVAQRYLSAPATSVDSKRVFSVAGHLFDSRRSKLGPQKAEQLVFLNRNLPALSYRY